MSWLMPFSGSARESIFDAAHFTVGEPSSQPRHIHIVTAADEPDRDRQMAQLVEAGVVGARDGFLCLIGKPLVQ